MNNVTDSYQVYMQNSGIPSIASGPTQVFSATAGGTNTFKFRNSPTTTIVNNDLVTFNMGSASTGAAIRVDDINVDLSGQNLVSPIPEPGTLALGGVVLAAAAGARRLRPAVRGKLC